MRGRGVLLVSEVILFLVSLVLLINGSESRHDVRRRSQQHLSVCRKEFLRPLDKRIADVDLVFTGIVERIYQQFEQSTSDDDSGSGAGERRRRQHQVAAHHRRHHRHHHRSHRQHDVRSFSPGGSSDWNPGSTEGSAGSGNSVSVHYRGIVRVKRIIKGDKRFQGKRVIVEGFGSDKFCVSDAKERDTRIFFTNPILNGRLRIHSSLMHVNLENLKKVFLANRADVTETPVDRNETSLSWTSPPTEATTRTTTTTTTTTTYAPIPQSSPSPATDMRMEAVAVNEIDSASRSNDERGKKRARRKKKKSKGKNRKNRRKHLHHVSPSASSLPASFSSSTTESSIDASSSTLSIIESLMETQI